MFDGIAVSTASRIVVPAMDMKADRVWLITHDKSKVDEGDKFVKLIQTKFKAARIECLQEQADRIDLFDVLRVLRTIILKEKDNSILVNVSVGSKIQAIASMMACIMLKDTANIKPYYVAPERYNSSLSKEDKQETEGVKQILPMPEYKIELPNEKLIKCLDIINRNADGSITKRELKDSAIEAGLIHVDCRYLSYPTSFKVSTIVYLPAHPNGRICYFFNVLIG